ncbi:MAG: hypothetical protein ACI8RP_001209 [Urechidicola sp.]|jgi:hypothetical protein|tara:strand:- start:1927 stop:2538 length:612 start_codon:yes stop_codon:yes gene_type:complete
MGSFFIALELISAIIGTINYKKFASKYTAYFLFFLWYIVLAETTSVILKKYGYSNTWIYVVYTFLEFNILLLMYKSITKLKFTKKIILLFIVLINIIYFIEVYKQGFTINTSITTVVGSIFLSIVLILYLKEFLYSDKILNYSRSLYFWITLGSLVYYLGSVPFQAMTNYLKNRDLIYLQISLAVFAQVCVIIGFLWSKKETK